MTDQERRGLHKNQQEAARAYAAISGELGRRLAATFPKLNVQYGFGPVVEAIRPPSP